VAKKKASSTKKQEPTLPPRPKRRRGLIARVRRWLWRTAFLVLAIFLLTLYALRTLNPPTTPYMWAEASRLGGIDHQWVPLGEIAPVLARSVVAAEDANFCNHFGFDMAAIRAAVADGGGRGASTITQQMVKNLFLWHGRSWTRKALEAVLTPVIEVMWPKARILEVYLNIAEFDEGVFGVDAAAHSYFKLGPDELGAVHSARLAAVLPNPKGRNAGRPTPALRKRAAAILEGAATLAADGRAGCFEG